MVDCPFSHYCLWRGNEGKRIERSAQYRPMCSGRAAFFYIYEVTHPSLQLMMRLLGKLVSKQISESEWGFGNRNCNAGGWDEARESLSTVARVESEQQAFLQL